MFIQTEQTPNPATLKFLPGKTVMDEGVAEFTDPTRPSGCRRWPPRVFKVDGVTGVYLGARLHQRDQGRRRGLAPAQAGRAGRHHGALPLRRPGGARRRPARRRAAASVEDDPTVRQIKELIETRVRPAVAQDGGDIVFHGFERGVVYLHLRGACSGCPSSIVTLEERHREPPQVLRARGRRGPRDLLIRVAPPRLRHVGRGALGRRGRDGADPGRRGTSSSVAGHAERLLPMLDGGHGRGRLELA